MRTTVILFAYLLALSACAQQPPATTQPTVDEFSCNGITVLNGGKPFLCAHSISEISKPEFVNKTIILNATAGEKFGQGGHANQFIVIWFNSESIVMQKAADGIYPTPGRNISVTGKLWGELSWYHIETCPFGKYYYID